MTDRKCSGGTQNICRGRDFNMTWAKPRQKRCETRKMNTTFQNAFASSEPGGRHFDSEMVDAQHGALHGRLWYSMRSTAFPLHARRLVVAGKGIPGSTVSMPGYQYRVVSESTSAAARGRRPVVHFPSRTSHMKTSSLLSPSNAGNEIGTRWTFTPPYFVPLQNLVQHSPGHKLLRVHRHMHLVALVPGVVLD